jgi:hypothetical protein
MPIKLLQENKPAIANILIQIGDRTIGIIQTIDVFEEDENGNTLEYPQATAYWVRFDKKAIDEAFNGRALIHSTAQKYPFNIEVVGGEKPASLQNCWILAVSYSYLTEEWIIVDEMRLEMEKFIPR